MRLFLDANVVTYVAFFEPFLVEGPTELRACVALWNSLQGTSPDADLRREIEALRILYLLDEQSHFDWLCSDRGIAEIQRIRSPEKRNAHSDLLERLLEHRRDVYAESGDRVQVATIEERLRVLFPNLPSRMESDALQFCEGELLDAYYFVTNDRAFSRTAAASGSDLVSCRPSELPFVAKHLTGEIEDLWPRE